MQVISGLSRIRVKEVVVYHLATVSSLSKKSPSTIEISSIIRCLHFFHCWATWALEASSTQFSIAALPEPIPGKLSGLPLQRQCSLYKCTGLFRKQLSQRMTKPTKKRVTNRLRSACTPIQYGNGSSLSLFI